MKIKVGLLLSLVLLFVSTSSAHASIRQGVLGLTTDHLSLPPTAEGPGFLLPDSPLYFLDNLKQQIRLVFAFTPTMKANVYSSIAGERLAELRFELLKNNISAAEIALNGVRENTKLAALSLDDSRLAGNNVEKEASDINLQIKQRLVSLDALELQSTGEMKSAIAYTTQTMADAKAVAEDGMQKDLAKNEVRDDISREVALQFIEASNSAQQIKIDLDLLEKSASSGAQKTTTAGNEIAKTESNKNVLGDTTPDSYKLELQTTDYVNQILSQLQKATDAWNNAQK